MLDDLMEVLLDILGEVGEALLSSRIKSKRKVGKKDSRKTKTPNRELDPWEQKHETPPWEK